MFEYIENIAAILFGLLLIVGHKRQAKYYAKWQTDTFGRHVPAWEIKFGEKANIIGGFIFIAFGLYGIVDLLMK